MTNFKNNLPTHLKNTFPTLLPEGTKVNIVRIDAEGTVIPGVIKGVGAVDLINHYIVSTDIPNATGYSSVLIPETCLDLV